MIVAAGCDGKPTDPISVDVNSAVLTAQARVDPGDNPVTWWWQIATTEAGIGPANQSGATARCVSGPANPPAGEYDQNSGLQCNVTGLAAKTNYYYKFCGDTARTAPTCSGATQQFATCGRPWLRASGSARDPSEPGVELDVTARDCGRTGQVGVDKLWVYIDDVVAYADTVPCANSACSGTIGRQLQLPFAKVIGTHTFRVEAENHLGDRAVPLTWKETTPAEGTIAGSATAARAAAAASGCRDGRMVGHKWLGTGGDDCIAAIHGAKTVNGLGGNDVIYGGDNKQIIRGGNGADTLYGERSNDTLIGDGGNDRLYGGVGDDHLFGGGGDDLLAGGHGADLIKGQGNDDIIRGGGTEDDLFGGSDTGGSDTDTLSFVDGVTAGSPGSGEPGLNIDLTTVKKNSTTGEKWWEANNSIAGYGGGQDDIPLTADVERVVGTQFEDHIVGGTGITSLDGGPGGDALDGKGVAALNGGDGDDGCVNGTSTASCERQSTTIVPRNPNVVSVALVEEGTPPTTPSYKALLVNGTLGPDTIRAEFSNGTVTLKSSSSAFSTAPIAGCPTVTAAMITCQVPAEQLDVLELAGSDGNDTLTVARNGFPQTTSVMLLGGTGRDKLTSAGNTEDVLVDGPLQAKASAADATCCETLAAGNRDDQLMNNDGADRLKGGAGYDVLLSTSTCDGDHINGGGDIDNASWAKLTGQGVYADLQAGIAGQRGTDHCPQTHTPDALVKIEDLEGSSQDDTLMGNGNDNSLLGRLGSDNMQGGAGSDSLSADDGIADEAVNCGPDADPPPDVDRHDSPFSCGRMRHKSGKHSGDRQDARSNDPRPRLDDALIADGDAGPSPDSFWKLDEAAGTVADDAMENGIDAAYVGNPSLRASGAVVDSGTAVHLDGQNDYIDLTTAWDPASAPEDCQVKDYAIELWVKFNGPPSGTQYLFSRSNGVDETAIYRSADGRLGFKTTTGRGSPTTVTDAPVSFGAWHHVVGTLSERDVCATLTAAAAPIFSDDTPTITLHVDGFAYPLGYSGGVFPVDMPNAHNLIGVKSGTAGWLNADVDDVAIYEDLLTADDVAQHLAASDALLADPLLLTPTDRTDGDGDGAFDSMDNCASAANADQADADLNGVGDACDAPADSDSDDVPDTTDNCPSDYNDDQVDGDSDGIGDACDPTP